MKNLKESEKNFLTCAILIALVGIALVFLDQTTLGILSIIAAGVFVAIFFKMVITRKKEEKEEEKSSGVEPLMLRGLPERIRQKNL